MLITLLTPSEGTASVAGHDIRAQPGQVRRPAGHVPQLLPAGGSLAALIAIAALLYPRVVL